jgi:hypothetical protein
VTYPKCMLSGEPYAKRKYSGIATTGAATMPHRNVLKVRALCPGAFLGLGRFVTSIMDVGLHLTTGVCQ